MYGGLSSFGWSGLRDSSILSTTELRPMLEVRDRSCDILWFRMASSPAGALAWSVRPSKSRGGLCLDERLLPARGVRGGETALRAACGAGVSFLMMVVEHWQRIGSSLPVSGRLRARSTRKLGASKALGSQDADPSQCLHKACSEEANGNRHV